MSCSIPVVHLTLRVAEPPKEKPFALCLLSARHNGKQKEKKHSLTDGLALNLTLSIYESALLNFVMGSFAEIQLAPGRVFYHLSQN